MKSTIKNIHVRILTNDTFHKKRIYRTLNICDTIAQNIEDCVHYSHTIFFQWYRSQRLQASGHTQTLVDYIHIKVLLLAKGFTVVNTHWRAFQFYVCVFLLFRRSKNPNNFFLLRQEFTGIHGNARSEIVEYQIFRSQVLCRQNTFFKTDHTVF